MKKIFYMGMMLIMLVSLTLVNSESRAQATKEWTQKAAEKWYKKWVKGLKVVHPDYAMLDVREFAKQYHANQVWWDKAFEYLARTDLAAETTGRHDIDGSNVSATVSEGAGRDFSTARWESHKVVADIHLLITGGEMVGIAPMANATVTRPFNGTSDTANYTSEGKPYAYPPKTFFIIFPNQIHQPGVKAPGSERYKKVVVKVKVV